MGICRFKTSELKPLIEHALSSTEFDMGYENDKMPVPALLFVHDQGVYLMSNGIPRLQAADASGPNVTNQVAYAAGCDPNVGEFDDWYGMSRELVGGDDFAEVLIIQKNWLTACDVCETFTIDIRTDAIFSGFSGAKQPTTPQTENQPAILSKPIAELNLSVRARKGTTKLGVTTIYHLTRYAADDLMEVRNFGAVSLQEVREKLAEHGLTLKGETLADQRHLVSR